MFAKGKLIGEGHSRRVYEDLYDPTCVIKEAIEGRGVYHNFVEYEVWGMLGHCEPNSYPAPKLFLAPVLDITKDGKQLRMKKTTPIKYKKDLPDFVPKFVTDIKKENFGWYEGRLVCHDYGGVLLIETPLTPKKTKKY